jgi:hypothetical protein
MTLIAEAQGCGDLAQGGFVWDEHLFAAFDALSHLILHGAAAGCDSKQSDHVEAADAGERCQLIGGEAFA